jgi:hypothetical protein
MLLPASLFLLASLFFCWRPYCVGSPAVAFIPSLACVPDVVGGYVIAVILPVAGVTAAACYC